MAGDLTVCRCGHPLADHDFDPEDDMFGWCWYEPPAYICDCYEFEPLCSLAIRLGGAPAETVFPRRRR